MEKKIEMKPEILCEGLADEFRQYFKYVRELQFTEEPNYNYLLGLFNNAMKNNNIKNDYKFDWNKSNDNTTSSEKFISTENLFSKLKLGGLNFNFQINDNISKNNNKNNEKNNDNINNINENKDNDNNLEKKENNNNDNKLNVMKEDIKNENEKK